MAERLSTGLADAINTVGCVKDIMANGVIHIYSGSQPSTADLVESGTLLMIITVASGAFVAGVATNGLNMGISTDGVLAKSTSEVWSGVGLTAASTGTTAGYFRWYDNDAVTGASEVAVRLDGAIGTSSSYEMQMSNNVIAESGTTTITEHNYTTTMA